MGKVGWRILLAALLGLASEAGTITVAGTADLQGAMEPSEQRFDLNGDGKKETATLGGISRIAALYRQIRKENPGALIVSSGDDLMGRYFHTFKGKAVFRLLSEAGVEYYALGNHEFDQGPDVLAGALKEAKFTVLCSDLVVAGTPLEGLCRPWVLREIGGVKVGIFSLMTEGLPRMSDAGKVRLRADNVTVAREMVKLLRRKGAQVVILLSHIGYKKDVAVAKQVKGIDLIFGGHSHGFPRRLGHIGSTVIANGGELGPVVTRVDLPLDGRGRPQAREATLRYLPVRQSIAPVEEVERELKGYEKRFPPVVVLGRSDRPWDLSEKALRRGESEVADMIDDLLRRKFGVEIVLNNSGAFRGREIYPAGEVTDKRLREIDAFRNAALIFRLKGKYLKPVLEHSAAEYGKGGWLQVSGLRYRVDLSRPVQKLEGEKIVRPGGRVSGIEVLIDGTWHPVEPEREYTILANAFLVERAGDGYFWFRKYGKNPDNTYTTFYSVMAEELSRSGRLNPPKADGRIEVTR